MNLSFFFRHLLVLLIAVTVPVEALAMVARDICVGHAHGTAAGHGEHDGHEGADAGAASADNSKSGTDCPPCTMCCGAASIAHGSQVSMPEHLKTRAFDSAIIFIPWAHSRGPERPPRSIS